MFFNEPSKLDLTKVNNSKINGDVFELLLTYSLPIECHFNYNIANKVLDWHNFQHGCPIFHGQPLPAFFLRRALKLKILSTTLLFTNVLFCSKVGIIRNELFFCGFYWCVNSGKSLSNFHKAQRALCKVCEWFTRVYTPIKSTKRTIHSYNKLLFILGGPMECSYGRFSH